MAPKIKDTKDSPPSAERLTRSFRARVVENLRLNEHHQILTFDPLQPTPAPRPGQFYMLSTGTSSEPLLKRPFCFFKRTERGIQILYRIRGKGSALLRDKPGGSVLEIVGPLGQPYPMPPRGSVPVVVAGGIAVASVFPHLQRLRGKAIVLFGGRTSEELLMLEELKEMAKELHVSTDNGSMGRHGTVLDSLKSLSLDSTHVLYACGPRGMLNAVHSYAREKGLRGYASLEEYMACGIGACMGCVVNTIKGYRRVCKEGPVFKLEELVL